MTVAATVVQVVGTEVLAGAAVAVGWTAVAMGKQARAKRS